MTICKYLLVPSNGDITGKNFRCKTWTIFVGICVVVAYLWKSNALMLLLTYFRSRNTVSVLTSCSGNLCNVITVVIVYLILWQKKISLELPELMA